jgi:hypothetical protein
VLHHGASSHLAHQFKSLQVAARTPQQQARPRFWCLLQVVAEDMAMLMTVKFGGLAKAVEVVLLCAFTQALKWEPLRQLLSAGREVIQI